MQQISKEKPYQEQGFESRLLRVGAGNFFSKVFLKTSNQFLQISFTKKCQSLLKKNKDEIILFETKYKFLKNLSFPPAIIV